MAEKEFQTALSGGMKLYPHVHYFKIPDFPIQALRGAGVELKMRGAQKPYDCYCLHFGLFIAMELKQQRGLSLGKNDLKPHQEEALLAAEEAGGCGLVVVNFQSKLSAKEAKARGVEVLDVAYAAPICEVVNARERLGRDSIPLTWWEARAWALPRKGTRRWDPGEMLAAAREWRMETPWGGAA